MSVKWEMLRSPFVRLSCFREQFKAKRFTLWRSSPGSQCVVEASYNDERFTSIIMYREMVYISYVITLVKPMPELDQSALKAKNQLLALFLVHIVLDAMLMAIARDLWAISRILVTIVVMYFVLQGRKWAKWVLMGIFSFLVVALTALVIFLYSKLSTVLIVGSSILTVLSAIIAIYIAVSQDLNRYFSHKRQASS